MAPVSHTGQHSLSCTDLHLTVSLLIFFIHCLFVCEMSRGQILDDETDGVYLFDHHTLCGNIIFI